MLNLNKEEFYQALNKQFKDYCMEKHGQLNSGDIQTLAMFVSDINLFSEKQNAILFNKILDINQEDFIREYNTNLDAKNISVLDGFIKSIKKEYLICSAIWYKDLELKDPEVLKIRGFAPYNVDRGIVFSGWRHPNCLYQKVALTGLADSESREYIQGFLTNKNRFVDREEGGKIAFEAGQTQDLIKHLTSEDIY